MRNAVLGSVLRSLLPVVGAGLLALGCGPKFDPPSELRSLRVLGVQKDEPYAKPGDSVNLKMLWEDASVDAALPSRKVNVTWSGPCFNPAGDLYYGCFANTDAGASTVADIFADRTTGDTTTVQSMTDVIPAGQSNDPPFGLAFVFFAACAGTLTPIQTTEPTAIPIGCQDAAGNLLGSDDFVAGYTSVYFYDDKRNANPFASGFEFQGQALSPETFCTDHGSDPTPGADNCQAIAEAKAVPDIRCDKHPELCVPTCADDADSAKCPGYAIRPTIDQNLVIDKLTVNDEQDTTSGRTLGEQMWIDYYADAGKFKSSVRLLNDATAGWNDDYGTQFYAPKTPGLARIWALVHDNRGGVGWSGITIKVQ
jgi:hypothetical protein